MMKALNINVAGDFLVMASTLLHIKSRLLLPQLGEDEEEDPRVEITRPLLEYLRLKEMAGELLERELLDRDVFTRRLSPDYAEQLELEGEEQLLDVNLFQLMDAFKRILDERLPGVPLRVEFEKWSLREKTTFILDRLKDEGSIYFRDLFSKDRTISEFIVTFLALLELVHVGMIRVFQPDPHKDIRLKALFEDNEEN
jgi:segregation and condensation protein A